MRELGKFHFPEFDSQLSLEKAQNWCELHRTHVTEQEPKRIMQNLHDSRSCLIHSLP